MWRNPCSTPGLITAGPESPGRLRAITLSRFAEAVSGNMDQKCSQPNRRAGAEPRSKQLVSLLGSVAVRNDFMQIPGPIMVLEDQQEQKSFFSSSDLGGPSSKASSLGIFTLTWGTLACPSEVELSPLRVCNHTSRAQSSPGEMRMGRNLTDSQRQVCSCALERLSVSLGIALWVALGSLCGAAACDLRTNWCAVAQGYKFTIYVSPLAEGARCGRNHLKRLVKLLSGCVQQEGCPRTVRAASFA